MRFEVLGPLRLDGAEPAGGLQRVLLALLLSRANSPVSTDLLIDAMWGPRPDPRAAQKLQFHVHKLRRAIDAERLSFGPAGYELRVLDGESDVGAFTALVSEATASEDPANRAVSLRAALDLWRGTPYEGVENPALDDEVARLTEQRLTALELWYEAEIALGNHAEISTDLTATVRAHPLRERLHALLMTALHQAGRRADALAVYRDARRTLVDELGIEPGAELREAEARVLAGDSRPAPEPSQPPAQLPHSVRGFVGRDTELSTLDECLAGQTLTVLAGTGGVGKTALAVQWAHRVRGEFPDGQLYVDLCGYGPQEPVAPEEVLAGFLLALGIDREALPRGAAERAARFRTIVDGRRMLLVLDNARTVELLRPLLPGTESVFVLVTSRDRLGGLVVREGARRIDLDRLSAARARELVVALAGDRIADTEADTLVERCARLPLALRVAAELIRSRPESNAEELVAELADEQGPLDALDIAGDPQASVRAVLSWSYHHLPDEAARLFRLCALHPGTVFCVYTLAALAGVTPKQVRRQIEQLTAANLFDRTSDGHHRPHDLLRAYADELVHELDSDASRRAARSRLFDFYRRAASAVMDLVDPDPMFPRPARPEGDHAVPPLRNRSDAVRWLDSQRANLATVARYAVDHDWPDVPIHLSDALEQYLVGHVEDGAAIHEAARTAARRTGDRHAEARACRFLGVLYSDVDAAFEYSQHALELFRAEDDQRCTGLTLARLGWLQYLRSDYVEALDRFEEAWLIFETIGDAASNGLGRVLAGLGAVHMELANHDDAVECLTLALRIAVQEGNLQREGRVRMMLGSAYFNLGKYEEAREHSERAERLAAEGDDRVGLAQLFELGRIYWRLGRRNDAYAALTRTVNYARESGSEVGEVTSMLIFGELRLAEGRPAEALRDFGATLDLTVRTGLRHDQARAHDGLGDSHAALGEPDAAREHWQRALAIFQDLDAPEVAAVLAKFKSV